MIDMIDLYECPICGGKDIPKHIHIISRTNIRSGYSNCQNCGQLFLNPRMTDRKTLDYYKGDYRDILSGDSGILPSDLATQQARAKLQMPLISGYVRRTVTMLEVGSSAGYLLSEAGALGYCAIGIEPDVRYHTISPACNHVIYDDLAQVDARGFDVIAMSHSLEHLNHPVEYLRELTTYAADDAIMMIEVPNSECNKSTYQIHHPFCYTSMTLTGLMSRVGWRALEVVYHGLNAMRPMYILGIFERAK